VVRGPVFPVRGSAVGSSRTCQRLLSLIKEASHGQTRSDRKGEKRKSRRFWIQTAPRSWYDHEEKAVWKADFADECNYSLPPPTVCFEENDAVRIRASLQAEGHPFRGRGGGSQEGVTPACRGARPQGAGRKAPPRIAQPGANFSARSGLW